MAGKIKVRRPTTSEIQELSKGAMARNDPNQRRRAEALMLYGMGVKPLDVAMAQGVHPNTVYKDLRAFKEAGLDAIEQLQSKGAPSRITAKQVSEIVKLTEQSPQDVGLPYGRWSLRKLSAYLVKKHIVKSIGRERLRQLLKKTVSASGGCSAS